MHGGLSLTREINMPLSRCKTPIHTNLVIERTATMAQRAGLVKDLHLDVEDAANTKTSHSQSLDKKTWSRPGG